MSLEGIASKKRRSWLITGLVLSSSAIFAALVRDLVFMKERRKPLLIAGSSLMFSVNSDLAHEFAKSHPLFDILIEKGGSIAGLVALKRGVIDLAAMSQEVALNGDDLLSHSYLVARNSISFIVHRSSPIKSLSQSQIQAIFNGRIQNWQQVGAMDAPINVISRSKPSTTRQFVEDIVLDHGVITNRAKIVTSPEELVVAIEEDPLAIGYVSLQEMTLKGSVARLQVDGIEFSRATILSGRYPYAQDLFFLSYGEVQPHVAEFIRFVESPEAQEIIERHNLISTH